MAKAKRPTTPARLDPLAHTILACLLADFRQQGLGSDALHEGYIGSSLPSLMEHCRVDEAASKVDFDLALKQLEDNHFVGTGPMEPYENDPCSSIVVLMIFSKREYAYLTEDGYRAAQASPQLQRSTRSMITNNFHGPVNAVAQGNATIGSVHQNVSAPTPAELADAVAKILSALPSVSSPLPDTTKATLDLVASEKELREGKMPFGRLLGSLNVLGKAEDVARRAPEAVHHIQTLLSSLGMS